MFTFLRNIRKSLLNENKVGRYLIYALGEILLIVIGILLALQINSWNADRNERNLERQYIDRLTEEMEDQILQYQNLKDQFTRQEEAVTSMNKIFNQNPVQILDTAQFWRKIFAAGASGPWYREPVNWTQLVKSGDLKLIRDDKLVEALLKHYSEVESTTENFKGYPTQTINEARKLIAVSLASSEFTMTPMERQANYIPVEALPMVLAKKKGYIEINARMGIIARIHVGIMESLIDSGKDVLELLEQSKESHR